MINVYIDPFSYYYLSDNLFGKYENKKITDDRLLVWFYLRERCLENDISLKTIDLWKEDKASKGDIYLTLDHKHFLQKVYWYYKNRNYSFVDLGKFGKKILIHIETPMVTPGIYKKIDELFKIYDKIYFTSKVGSPKCGYFQIPRPYNTILPEYWNKSDRKFLAMININKRPRLLRLLTIYTRLKPKVLQKELLGERIKAIEFFSRTCGNEFDLYGLHWQKTPPFPYCFSKYKKAIKKVYKGVVDSKYQKLSDYNFAIAYENCITEGFIGEALFDCFYAGTVPIYLGASDIEKYIPKDCFIDLRDFENYEELRKFLKSLTRQDIENYKTKARQFLESDKFWPFSKEYFAKFFIDLIKNQL